eukprot:m.199587 g.199587  ORF g.199587 m.199587 type:complete len:157 (-) comp32740_c0_seq1:337-807(-)
MASQGCCDNIQMDCGCLDTVREKRNMIASASSGVLFAVAWWVIIDASLVHFIEPSHQVIGAISSLGLIMVNSISGSMIDGDSYSDGVCGPAGMRLWLIIGLMMSFGGFIAGAWVMSQQYLKRDDRPNEGGISLFFQNVLIFISSMIFKFGRAPANY